MADEQYAAEKAAAGRFGQQQEAGRALGQEHATDLYGALRKGYGGLATGGANSFLPSGGLPGYTAPQFNLSSAYNQPRGLYEDFSKTGGIDQNAMRRGYGTFEEAMKTGLVDEGRRRSLEETIGGLKEFGRTGGLDEASINRFRGGGGYEEFAKTGGVDEAQRANIRARAASPIAAQFGLAQEAANRQRAVQGGYGPGASALSNKLRRGATQDASNAALNAEADIMNRVTQGRQFGITGQTSSEQALQNLRTGNMLGGLTGAGGFDMGLINAIQSGKMFGAQGITGAERDIQSLAQGGKMFGTQGLHGLADTQQDILNRNASASASASNAAADNARWLAQFGLQSQLAGLGGLEGLYSGGPGGEITQADQFNLANRGQLGQTTGNLIGQKFAANPSGWDRFSQIAPSILGGAGAALTGFGMGGANPRGGGGGSFLPSMLPPTLKSRQTVSPVGYYGG